MEDQKTILVIDNEPEIIKLVEEMLADRYRIDSVLSGKDAIRLLDDRKQFDLILLDIMMPEMDGWKVYDKLKSDTILSQIPVAIFSARYKMEDIQWAFEEKKVDDYIVKPFEMEDFLTRVDKLVLSKKPS